jgi:hypothetical protein
MSGRSESASHHAASTHDSLSFAKRVDVVESQSQDIYTRDDLEQDIHVKDTYAR